MKSKEQTFFKGALILGFANFIVKIIGAVFKIPLYELIGKDGSGLFNVAYQIYTFMFIIATAGFPIAVSKMVAESIAHGDERDARKIFENAFIMLGIIGIAGSAVLYTFSDELAGMLGNPDAALGIKVISPAVFLVALVSAFRGYFQGRQNMYPTAASEVIEASAKLGVGIILALFFMKMIINPDLPTDFDFAKKLVKSTQIRTQLASAGAITGVTCGTALSLILMIIVYAFSKRKKDEKALNVRTSRNIQKELILIAIPITIGASVSSLTSLVDLATVMNRLVVNPAVFDKYAFLFGEGTQFAKDAIMDGWTQAQVLEKQANSLYGMYTGQAQTMFNLPLTIVVALGMSVVPAISASVAKGDRKATKNMTESVIRITVLFAMPCAIGMSVLSKEILGLLYSDSDAFLLLEKLSIAVIFVSVVSVTNSILQAHGKVYYPVINMLVGGVVKVTMNYFCIPVFGIDGAPIATNVCYAIIALLNIICIVRVVKIKFSILDFILKPFAASAIMGAVAVVVSSFLENAIGGGRVATLLAICVAGVVYFVAVFAVKAIKKEDILNLPKGEKIADLLTRTKLLR